MRKIAVILVFGIILFGCNKNETMANYEIKIPDGKHEDGMYLFINNSTDADTYFWEFGDGEVSNDFEPIHFYSKYGTFTTSLMVSRKNKISKKIIILRYEQ